MSFLSFPTGTSQRLDNAQDRLHLLALRSSIQQQRAATILWRIVTFFLLLFELGSYFLAGYGLSALFNALLK